MKVYLIRHSEPTYDQVTAANLHGYGRELGALTTRGIQIARKRAHDPLFKNVQLILASPYTRALQTALEFVRYNDLPLKVELDLREWQPDNTGKRADNDQQAAAAYQAYLEHPHVRPADCPFHYDTAEEMRTRFTNVLKRYAANYNCIACISHGEIIHQLGDWNALDYCDVREMDVN
ncbi:histidine phosphatase family protein [Lactiplantibacillus garii]|uniref:Histidine phosphatase family protein n=1 Tax=Lactiplantibacillus garii TaxID=2306423 RepID=A0A3R8KNG2_9LACO|nr:histidine phosphatase family protein [Lactiplantibacillus garii]RRK11639.1 histidine phosphatase family protein [Lactiplantibacillus garii]